MKKEQERHALKMPVPALIGQPLQPFYQEPAGLGKQAATADVLLHGQLVRVKAVCTEKCAEECLEGSPSHTKERCGRFFECTADYGYGGFLPDGAACVWTEQLQKIGESGCAENPGYGEAPGCTDAERMETARVRRSAICRAYLQAYRETEEKGLGNIYSPHAPLATVWAPFADLLEKPDVTDTCCARIALPRGAKLYADPDQSGVKEDWTRVFPLAEAFCGEKTHPSGDSEKKTEGNEEKTLSGAYYVRSSALKPPFALTDIDYDEKSRMEGCAVYGHVTPHDEAAFRRNVTETAKLYLHTQYRWAGKTSLGIDCSGLCSMAYMLNGVYIFRDARIEEGYPVQKIVSADFWKQDRDAALSRIREGDLLYFKGHIAMYLGEGRYIHATGRAGSDAVVINSLLPGVPDYREDLCEGLIAAGSVIRPEDRCAG